jgi:hypothetical protein
MIWRRPTVRAISSWALAAMLLAQIALAVQACELPALRPAAAFSAGGAHSICDADRQPVDLLCLAHCLQADQAVDSPHDSVAAVPTTALSVPPMASLALAPRPISGEGTALPTGPPVYLRSLRLRL